MIRLPPTPLFGTSNTDVYLAGDLIKPSNIEHIVDENFNFGAKDDVCEYFYNHIDYFFDLECGRIWARAYADEMDHVFIYLPDEISLQHPDALRVLHYLKRRYGEIRRWEHDVFVKVEVEQIIEPPKPR